MTFGVQYQAELAGRREREKGARIPEPAMVSPLMDFGNWSEDVSDFPPVLLVRIIAEIRRRLLDEGCAGAASTQGMASRRSNDSARCFPGCKPTAATRGDAHTSVQAPTASHRDRYDRRRSVRIRVLPRSTRNAPASRS